MIEENQTYDVYYDKEADFLEISLGEPTKDGTTEEIEPGIFVTREAETNEVKNIGILDFGKRVTILKKVLNKFNIAFPLDINISD